MWLMLRNHTTKAIIFTSRPGSAAERPEPLRQSTSQYFVHFQRMILNPFEESIVKQFRGCVYVCVGGGNFKKSINNLPNFQPQLSVQQLLHCSNSALYCFNLRRRIGLRGLRPGRKAGVEVIVMPPRRPGEVVRTGDRLR